MLKPSLSLLVLLLVCSMSLAASANRDYGVIKNQDSPQAKLKSVDLKDVGMLP